MFSLRRYTFSIISLLLLLCAFGWPSPEIWTSDLFLRADLEWSMMTD